MEERCTQMTRIWRMVLVGIQFLNSRTIKQIACVYVITFVVILPIACRKMKYSIYYKPLPSAEEKTLLKNHNNERIAESEEFLARSNNRTRLITRWPPRAGVTIAIGIVAVARNKANIDESYKPRYLVQSVASMIKELGNQTDVSIAVCNVDTEPSEFLDSLHVETYVTVYSKYLRNKYNDSMYEDIRDKEKDDYVYCLKKLTENRSKYVLLVEDDALPKPNFMPVLRHVIKQRLKNLSSFGFLKLYHPERLLGYFGGFELVRICELIGLAVTFGSIITFVHSRVAHILTVRRVWSFWIVLMFLIVAAIGRQNINELRRVSQDLYQLTPAPSCCTPAILYTHISAEDVIKFLGNSSCNSNFHKDTALDKYKEQRNGLLINPNLFTHIGLYSSLSKETIDPAIV